jgi:predicted Zn-dependent protease
MPFERNKLEWFQVLNGLDTKDHLVVGQQVKVVSK